MSLTWSHPSSFSLSKWASVSRSICFESSLATQIKCNQCPNVPASPRFTSSQTHPLWCFPLNWQKKWCQPGTFWVCQELRLSQLRKVLTHIPVPETNTLKQGEAWPREETAGSDYLGLRCLFLDMWKIRPGSNFVTSFDDNQFHLNQLLRGTAS